MVVKPSILTSFKWQYVFVATMGHMVASGDVGSKWKQLDYFDNSKPKFCILECLNLLMPATIQEFSRHDVS